MTNNKQKLIELAKAFSPYATLYQVGGCVRDMLLGVDCYDIDVCSQLEVDDVKKILLSTDFDISTKSLRMGTVHISYGDFSCEYTTFRQDSYNRQSGAHHPQSVTFTNDILLDAKRRDFKCNAIYYDVLKDEIVDVLCGVDDIKAKLVSTADTPSEVFEADGLRILRMVRFCAELGFEPEEQTFLVARENAWRVKDLAVERVRDELNKIFVADTRHPLLNNHDAHIRGLRLLDGLGLIDILLPELSALKGIAQPKKYHLYDAYEHSVKAYEVAEPNLRWVSLLHDVGKAKAMALNNNMHSHDKYGEEIVKDIATRLKFSNAERDRLSRLVGLHMVDINGNTSKAKLRKFVINNIDYVDDVIKIMDIDAIASRGQSRTQNRLRDEYFAMRSEGIPLRIRELAVDGNDLIALDVKKEHRAKILKTLLIDTAMNGILKDKDRAIAYVERMRMALQKAERKN